MFNISGCLHNYKLLSTLYIKCQNFTLITGIFALFCFYLPFWAIFQWGWGDLWHDLRTKTAAKVLTELKINEFVI